MAFGKPANGAPSPGGRAEASNFTRNREATSDSDRRHEHLRVRNAQRQRQLLASLATSGQQTPIIVVTVSDQADRYLVIDGYKRVAALEQLRRESGDDEVQVQN